jgi:hypothetical protein
MVLDYTSLTSEEGQQHAAVLFAERVCILNLHSVCAELTQIRSLEARLGLTA